MKKLTIYGLLLLTALLPLTACGGEDDEVSQPTQAPMTTFRMSDITGISYPDDPFQTHVAGNAIHLHWFAVGDCSGYEVKYAQQEKVANDIAAWNVPENIEGHFIVSPEKSDTLLQDLQYATTYCFTIRVLSNKGEQYHSDWSGTGNSHQLYEDCQLTTEERPDTLGQEIISDNY